jgi:hypothetical protein
MKRILVICYLVIIALFFISSVTISFANDNFKTFIFEFIVDVIFIMGVLLFYTKKNISFWLLPFLFAVVCECILLFTDERATLSSAVFWLLILLPAIYMNIRVSFPVSKESGES